MNDINDILEEREGQHGSFHDNSETAQFFKEIIRANSKWEELASEDKEAIDNILQKISRYVTGGGTHEDSLTDIIGYTELMKRRIEL